MRSKPLALILLIGTLTSNAYASGMEGLAVIVIGIFIIPLFLPFLSYFFITKSPKTIIILNSVSAILFILLFFYAGGITPSPFVLLSAIGLSSSITIIIKANKSLKTQATTSA